MARRSRSRDLAGLAALGALAYNFLGPGRDRKDGTKAPVSDATPVPVERILRGSTAAEPRLQETFMGLDDVSGPQAETGGMGRSNVGAADQSAMPPPVSNAQAAAAPVRGAAAGRASIRTPINDREQLFDAPMVARRDPNISAEVARRTGVRLDSRAGAGRGGQGGPTAAELEAHRNRPYTPPPMTEEMRRQAERQAIAPVYPEEYLVGGPGLKSVHSAAKALANRGTAQRAADVGAATKAAEGREAVTNPMAWMAGPKGMKQMQAAEDAERKARRAMEARKDPKRAVKGEESDVTGGAIGYKKGGSVKAKPKKMSSGGMTSKVSSASKRADGIATKGKTKCKMY